MTPGEAPALPPESDQQFDVGSTEDSLDRMRQVHAQLGDAYRIFAPGRGSHTWVFNHPDDARRILITNHRNYAKGVGFDRIKILLGNGIIVSEGEFWKRQRRMLQPTFHRRILTQLGGIITRANAACLARWDEACARGEPINVTDDASTMTIEIILRMIFGDDVDAMTRESGENPFSIFTEEAERDLKFAYRFRKLAALIGKYVARRRAAGSEPAGTEPDYLSMMLLARDKENGDGMSDRMVVDEITTLIVAGHETTASMLNWTWYLLARNPEVEARLHAEIDAKADEPVPSLESMEELHYGNLVLQEVLRLYPPVWVISRRTIGPDVLGGYAVPADTDVFISPYFIHRHPEFWQDAESFQPERFEAADQDRKRLTYLPFSAGAHHCIGETLAIYEGLIHLSKVCRRFRLRQVDDTPAEFEALINLRTRKPIFMRLERR